MEPRRKGNPGNTVLPYPRSLARAVPPSSYPYPGRLGNTGNLGGGLETVPLVLEHATSVSMVLLLERIESRVNRVRSAPSYPERPTESTSFVPRENKLSETNLPTQSSYPSGSVRPSASLIAWLTRDFAIGTPSCNSTSRFDCVSKGDPHTFAMHAWNKIGSSSG